jgi:thymidylate synthase
VHFPSVVEELRWFLSGSENIADLNCGIWNKDAYNLYLRKLQENAPYEDSIELDAFIRKTGQIAPEFLRDIGYTHYGQTGKIYGAKWKENNQLINVLNGLKEQPMGRRHVVNAWSTDNSNVALPCCHYGFQIIPRPLSFEERIYLYSDPEIAVSMNGAEEWLDNLQVPKYAFTLKWIQRSVDLFLGLPFNIASYALLANIIGNLVNMVPEAIEGNLSHIHIYENALEACKNLPLGSIILDYPEVEIADYMVDLTIESIHDFFDRSGDIDREPFANLVPGTYHPATNVKVDMLAEKIVKP